MPSGPVTILHGLLPAEPQHKLCPNCHSPLTLDPSSNVNPAQFLPDPSDNAFFCPPCKERILEERQARDVATLVDIEERLEHDLLRDLHDIRSRSTSADTDMFVDSFEEPTSQSHNQSISRSPSIITTSKACASSSSHVTSIIPEPSNPIHHRFSPSPSLPLRALPPQNFVPPDPWVDITRIRVKSQGHDCLYPGATFSGTQRSGRNAYDVTVTVVDVDFTTSFLCGYLCIRGLTEDHPELTTYFDAEIIGNRYGFLTEQDWGATEIEDRTHWARFPAFRRVRPELRKPHLTMSERDRGVVFMRWKEKFLLPDHRVKDIHGASFAGFYYVCVEFGSQLPAFVPHDTSMESLPSVSPTPESLSATPRKDPFPSRSTPVTAVMTGFYFHKHSEPYQQLQLYHVPDRATSYFEFR